MGEAAREANDRKSTVIPRVGRYVGFEGTNALVDLGDQRIPVQFATAWIPEINEPVWVDSVDGVLRLTGPTAPKPGMGVVATRTGDFVKVSTDFGDFTMPFQDASPPTSGDFVGIDWNQGPKCYKLSTSPDPVEPPPPPVPPAPEVKSAEFRAIDAGSTDRGSPRWWQSQPWASNTTLGAWFYGGQIKDTIPAGAEFISLEFYVSYQQRQGDLPRFVLHNQPFKGPVPAVTGYTAWAPGGGWQTPPDPAGWFAQLRAGGSQWGVGLNQGGYNKFSSLAQDGLSGALRIRWR